MNIRQQHHQTNLITPRHDFEMNKEMEMTNLRNRKIIHTVKQITLKPSTLYPSTKTVLSRVLALWQQMAGVQSGWATMSRFKLSRCWAVTHANCANLDDPLITCKIMNNFIAFKHNMLQICSPVQGCYNPSISWSTIISIMSLHILVCFLATLERGPLSLVSTNEELLARKSSSSGLENQDCGHMDLSCWPRRTLYPQKVDTNFADEQRLLGRYSLLVDSSHWVSF
jgi:hypothetical protein